MPREKTFITDRIAKVVEPRSIEMRASMIVSVVEDEAIQESGKNDKKEKGEARYSAGG